MTGLLCTLLSGAGCTTAPPARTPATAQIASATKDDIQCHKEHVTGSLIATQVCTLKTQRDAIQRGTQDAKDFLSHQVIGACPGSPGCK